MSAFADILHGHPMTNFSNIFNNSREAAIKQRFVPCFIIVKFASTKNYKDVPLWLSLRTGVICRRQDLLLHYDFQIKVLRSSSPARFGNRLRLPIRKICFRLPEAGLCLLSLIFSADLRYCGRQIPEAKTRFCRIPHPRICQVNHLLPVQMADDGICILPRFLVRERS